MMYATVLIITDETSHTIQIKLELKKKILSTNCTVCHCGPYKRNYLSRSVGFYDGIL